MLKVADVAQRLNCSVAKIYQLIESKRLPHYRCPTIRVSEDQLAEYLASCSVAVGVSRSPPKSPRMKLKHIRL